MCLHLLQILGTFLMPFLKGPLENIFKLMPVEQRLASFSCKRSVSKYFVCNTMKDLKTYINANTVVVGDYQ
jgi:hypothetical protein